MTNIRKPFDLDLYRENDDRAKNAVATALNDEGLYCHVNDDKYGPDLCVYTGYRHKYYVECEIKRVWKAGQDVFPWDTIQIPERKLKFVKGTTKDVEFWVLREDCEMAVIIPDALISSSPLVEVTNSMIATGEKFIQVPIEHCIVRKLTE